MSKNFEVRPFEVKTISWWNSRRNKIDMDPPYQRRGKLWSPTDKAYLIDSIINGYDVPKIYIADFTWGVSKINVHKLPYAIIDGKQRFEAIFDFYDGKIVLNDDFTYLQNPNLKLSGLGYKDLLKYTEVIEEFNNFNLSVVGVYANNETPITELFLRLNRSKALTGAEIRNAMAGPASEFIREISKHEFFKSDVRFETKRGQDLNLAAKLLLIEYRGDFVDTKKNDLDAFVQQFQEGPDDRLELSGRRIFENLDAMDSIFLPYDPLLNSAGIIPVYYWIIKKLDGNFFSSFRELINNFEKGRRTIKQFIREYPNKIDNVNTTFIDYDNYNRNTNDALSHKGRYLILVDAFTEFRHTGMVRTIF